MQNSGSDAPAEAAGDGLAVFSRPQGSFSAPAAGFGGVWPFELDLFFSRFWSKTPCLVRGHPEDFSDLMPWSALNQILHRHQPEELQMRLVREAETLKVEDYTRRRRVRGGGVRLSVEPDLLAEKLREGHALVLDGVDRLYPPLEELTCSFESALGERVQVNLYAGWTTSRGFDVHWDDHDVYILQVHGRKRWKLFGRTRENPSFRDTPHEDAVPEEPVWEGLLNAGDCLYIPKGVWHVAEAVGGETLHLTVGVSNRTGVDFIEWLADYLLRDEFLRGDVPFHGSDAELADYGRRLQEKVSAGIDLAALKEFRGRNLAEFRHRMPHNLPISVAGKSELSDDATVTWKVHRNGNIRSDGDTFTVAAFRKLYRFKAEAYPIIQSLARREASDVKSVLSRCPEIDRETTLTFLAHLARLGLVEIVPFHPQRPAP